MSRHSPAAATSPINSAMKRVLLLSAYHADSHAAWTNWLEANIRDVEWISRTLPGRHFAAHEFQGISMLEAASAGARPLVPDALCYPEQYPDEYRYPAGDLDALVERLKQWIEQPPPRCDVTPWLSAHTGRRWQAEMAM